MSWHENHILPHLPDLACSTKPNMKQRQKIVPHAQGDVLEIDTGSGLNFAYLDESKVRKVWAPGPEARRSPTVLRTPSRTGPQRVQVAGPPEPGVVKAGRWLQYESQYSADSGDRRIHNRE